MSSSRKIFYNLFILNLAVLVLPFFISCSKSDTAMPTASNIQLQVANLSPDSYPVGLYINNIKVNPNYVFNATPAYFYLTNTNYPLQIRTSRVNDTNIVYSRDTINFQPNTRYTLFFTGLYSDKSLRSIVTVDDTATIPAIGKGGKIRFLNASPRSNPIDIWANGTLAYKNIAYTTLSNYITLPAGNYNFKVYPTGTSTSSLADLNKVTIQDGRLYTLYSRGLVGRSLTDTAAFGLVIVPNNPPKI